MHNQQPRVRFVHWIGFVLVGGLFVLALMGGVAGPAFGITGTILIITAIFHAIRGSSWLQVLTLWLKPSPILVGFLAGAVFFGLGWVLPSPDGDTALAEPLVEQTPSASPTTSRSPIQTATPSQTPSTTPSVTTAARITPSSAPGTPSTAVAADHPAAALLTELLVKGRAPKTGYDRNEFGQRWADTDRNGCDTRNDILNRDLTAITHKPGTRDCLVLTGALEDPFTGTTIDFVRGDGTSNAVAIDHVVALSDAWQKGAQQLDMESRTEFANDPLNLLAVDGPTNSAKGDGDAATWLPPNKAFRCEYVGLQIAVKHKYSLWVTQAEHDALARVLSSCANPETTETVSATPVATAVSPTPQPATTAVSTPAPPKAAALVATTPPPAAPATQAPAPVVEIPAPAAEDVYFKNCTAAKAAGAAPLYVGEPGYRKAMDRDGVIWSGGASVLI